jgi:hypothetical protein
MRGLFFDMVQKDSRLTPVGNEELRTPGTRQAESPSRARYQPGNLRASDDRA